MSIMTREQYNSGELSFGFYQNRRLTAVKPNNLSAFHVANGITASKANRRRDENYRENEVVKEDAVMVWPAMLRIFLSCKCSSLSASPLKFVVTALLDPSSVLLREHDRTLERPKTNRCIEDEMPLATRTRDRMRRAATPLDCSQAGAGIPPRAILSNLSWSPGLVAYRLDCLGYRAWLKNDSMG
ncbi:hypothetical protein C8J56DRAFT_1034906 [Mycena floridula]|nr:hypothetical protein C8J56DRAFT_1034906 [Mycena floridula]